MIFSTFSEWLSLRESKNSKKIRASKNTAIDAFLNAVEELEKDIEKLSKVHKKVDKKAVEKKSQKKAVQDKESQKGKDEETESDVKDKESEEHSDSDGAEVKNKKQID